MKKIFNIAAFSLLMLVVGTSCSIDEIDTFDNSANYVQFVYRLQDSTTVSFKAHAGATSFTHEVDIELLGTPFASETEYSVEVMTEKSTAVKGVHYNIPEKLTFPAGTFKAKLPIEFIYNSVMDNTTLRLEINIVGKDNIFAGYNKTAVVRINNSLTKPTWWDSNVQRLFFGVYSEHKHECILEATGLTDINSISTYSELYSIAIEFKAWLDAQNPPIRERDTNSLMTVPV